MNQEPKHGTDSLNSGSMPEEGMVEKILSDGRAQADRALDSAQRSVESERRKAEAQAEKARSEILGRAERKTRVLKEKEIATAHIESKRVLLRAREEAISKIFGAIEQELARVREDPAGYRRALRNLAVEAVAAVGVERVLLKVAKEDEALADASFLKDVTAAVDSSTGGAVKFDMRPDPGISGGGCVAVSEDGRIVFDNTFRRRVERMKPQLRALIVKEVLKTNG
jgi:vacuolar-type H+-ATPase subunit E/Vma4